MPESSLNLLAGFGVLPRESQVELAENPNADPLVSCGPGGPLVRLSQITADPSVCPQFTSTGQPAQTPGDANVPHEIVGAIGGGIVELASSPLGQAIILNQLGIGTNQPIVVAGAPGGFNPSIGPGALGIPALSLTGDFQLPGIDIPGVDFGLSGAPCIRPNPATGRYPSEVTFVDGNQKIRSYRSQGTPILWSRDRSNAARTNKLLGGKVTKSGVTRSRRSSRAKPQVVCVSCGGGSDHE